MIRTLHEALRLAGSERMLARRLQVPIAVLRSWLAAEEMPPMPVFLAAVDIVCEDGVLPEEALSTGPEADSRRAPAARGTWRG